MHEEQVVRHAVQELELAHGEAEGVVAVDVLGILDNPVRRFLQGIDLLPCELFGLGIKSKRFRSCLARPKRSNECGNLRQQ